MRLGRVLQAANEATLRAYLISVGGRSDRQSPAKRPNAVQLRAGSPGLSFNGRMTGLHPVDEGSIPPSSTNLRARSVMDTHQPPKLDRCRFESCRARHFLDVAERILRRSSKSGHAGSIPAVETIAMSRLTARRSALNREIGVRFPASQPRSEAQQDARRFPKP